MNDESEFEKQEALSEHISRTADKENAGNADTGRCSVCSQPSMVRLPYEDQILCPTCAVGFFESKMVFGVPLINHMGPEYEEIFCGKVEKLLPLLGVKALSELGINVVLIEFSQGMDQFTHHASPRGELVFMFANTDRMRKIEKTVFERVINHEVYHFYVSNKLKLSVSEKFKGKHSFLEGSAAQLAEDIQLEKIAVEKGLMLLIQDEIKRVEAFFEKQQVPTRAFWNNLNDYYKLQSAVSVTWTYAEESWLLQTLKEEELKKQVRNNLKLVQPHYAIHGDRKIKDAILELFGNKIAETSEEAQMMCKKLARVFDSFAIEHNLLELKRG